MFTFTLFKATHGAISNTKRMFNDKTIQNIVYYLETNKDRITYFENESGFIRTTLPAWIYVPSIVQADSFNNHFKLRINYWTPAVECHIQESIHDHPAAFQSFIVNSGYQHEIFATSTEAANSHNISTFHFAMSKETQSISFQGKVILDHKKTQTTEKGNVVEIDNRLIHRVTRFDPYALSLNKVDLKNNKGVTNLFMLENERSLVKTKRRELSDADSQQMTESMLDLFRKC